MIDKIKYLNDLLKGKTGIYKGPSSVFKYRPFDQYTFDMLDNGYLFACQATNLDDKTECNVSFDVSDYALINSGQLQYEALNQFFEFLKPYCKKEIYDDVQQILLSCVHDGIVNCSELLQKSFALDNYLDDFSKEDVVNCIANIPDLINEKLNREKIEEIFLDLMQLKEKIGVCSLTTTPNNNDMWINYANNASGYCVEYDMLDYSLNKKLYPVIYVEEEERVTNVVKVLVRHFMLQFIETITHGCIESDMTSIIRLVLTKYKFWENQDEWRLIGDANTKISAPKIKCIYLGNNISEINRNKVIVFCQKKSITYIEYDSNT